MNETEDSLDSAPTKRGSWQPDPSGRYATRFRDRLGRWTDVVKTAGGEEVHDPVHVLSEVGSADRRHPRRYIVGIALVWLLGLPLVIVVGGLFAIGAGFSDNYGGDSSERLWRRRGVAFQVSCCLHTS